VDKNIFGIVFSFQSLSLKTLLQTLKEYDCQFPSDLLPDAFFFFDKGLIIHRWGWLRGRDIQSDLTAHNDGYSVRVGNTKESGAVIGTLLLMFFELVSRGTMGNASFMNAGASLNDKYTNRLADVVIGPEPKTTEA
jgi:hypothetical protein